MFPTPQRYAQLGSGSGTSQHLRVRWQWSSEILGRHSGALSLRLLNEKPYLFRWAPRSLRWKYCCCVSLPAARQTLSLNCLTLWLDWQWSKPVLWSCSGLFQFAFSRDKALRRLGVHGHHDNQGPVSSHPITQRYNNDHMFDLVFLLG